MIDFSSEQLDRINDRISESTILLDDDKRIVLAILSAYTWIQCQLERHKLSIKRLKNLFGFSTERRGKHNQKEAASTSPDSNNGNESTSLDADNTGAPQKKHLSGTH
jgi:hypothetical protein